MADPTEDLEAFRAEARTWLEENFPRSLAGRAAALMGGESIAASETDAIEWAKKMVDYGAGEILLTSMDRDGTKIGFDLELTRAISEAVSVPVIASGGVCELKHLAEGVTEGKADAVLAASIFHFGEYTIEEAKRAMEAQGVEVRL